jgi:exodeoxyribonuclease VII small subunit
VRLINKGFFMENKNPAPDSSQSPDAGRTLSFEQALGQLQDLVKKMESGAMPLSDSVKAYETGMKLKAYLEQMLKEAELKIEQLKA